MYSVTSSSSIDELTMQAGYNYSTIDYQSTCHPIAAFLVLYMHAQIRNICLHWLQHYFRHIPVLISCINSQFLSYCILPLLLLRSQFGYELF